ncbi:hypothetical protein [Dyella sp. 2RAB6]|uniref:hypothetical protein n=1 Tax=Dyella sp. 2RAB6 TaxID=3232992 RepID=UPI003F932CD9
MDVAQLAFAYQQRPLRVQLIAGTAWYDLADLCILLSRPSLDDAVAFVGSVHPQRLRLPTEGAEGSPWIDDDGLWSIVSLAGYRLADDLAQWLHLKVAPTIRHAIYEQVPNGDAVEVRELWHVMDQLLDIGAATDYGRGTGVLAINLTDMQLAAFRRDLPLPGKTRLSRLLASSKNPPYRGQTHIAHKGREILCLTFDRP